MDVWLSSMCTMCMQFLQKPEEGAKSPGTGGMDGYKLPGGCWALNLSPLQDQPALLTTEPSLYTSSDYS